MDEQLRASDADRRVVLDNLESHTASGRLTLPEFSDRAARVWSARTVAELRHLLADLPETAQQPPSAPVPVPERSGMNTRPRGRRPEWAAWGATGVICLAIWLIVSVASGSTSYFWPMWVIGPWGAVLVFGTLTGHHPADRTPGCRPRGDRELS